MTSAMPSMPSANWVPNAGIHGTANSSWKRAPATASATEYANHTTAASTTSASANAIATTFAVAGLCRSG